MDDPDTRLLDSRVFKFFMSASSSVHLFRFVLALKAKSISNYQRHKRKSTKRIYDGKSIPNSAFLIHVNVTYVGEMLKWKHLEYLCVLEAVKHEMQGEKSSANVNILRRNLSKRFPTFFLAIWMSAFFASFYSEAATAVKSKANKT